jgi:hypothetical protein
MTLFALKNETASRLLDWIHLHRSATREHTRSLLFGRLDRMKSVAMYLSLAASSHSVETSLTSWMAPAAARFI